MRRFILACLIASSGPLLAGSKDTIVLTPQNSLALRYEISSMTAPYFLDKLAALDTTETNEPIYVIMYTPGGEIQAGLNMLTATAHLRRPIKTISLFSASMGFQSVQNFGERLITASGGMMSHRAAGGFEGNFPHGSIQSRYDAYVRRMDDLDNITVKRTEGKHTLESYRKLINEEFWCYGASCVVEGFADRVVSARCDTHKFANEPRETVAVMEAMVSAKDKLSLVEEFSACPLNVDPRTISLFDNGKPIGQSIVNFENTREYHKMVTKQEELINMDIQERASGKVSK